MKNFVIYLMAIVGGSADAEVIETFCGTTKQFSEIFAENQQSLIATGNSLLGKDHTTFIWVNQFTKEYTILNKNHKTGKVCVMDGGENLNFKKGNLL